jgi:NADH-quinone oxidoreductase subunit A
MTPLVAYVLLFVAVGVVFIFVHLVAGKLFRPSKPGVEKASIYECGEPTIGSAWIQFDLRFYVVALLFVIFDVEVAFFFPWAEVFGKATALAAAKPEEADRQQVGEVAEQALQLIPPYREYEQERRDFQDLQNAAKDPDDFAAFKQRKGNAWSVPLKTAVRAGQELSWLALVEILVFFGVLLVGFAYLWKRGDLAWVRSTLAERPATTAASTNGAAAVSPPAPPPLVTTGSHT